MWGGTVASEAALKAIVTTNADDGLVIRVKNIATYQLDINSADTTAIAPDSGVGRWLPTAVAPTAGPSSGREVLAGTRTYHVSLSGSNANNGLTSATAFLTIQKAIDVISGALDLNGYTVTIQVTGAGIYDPFILKSFAGGGTVIIQGNSADPFSIEVRATSGSAILGERVRGDYSIRHLYLNSASGSGGDCIALREYANLEIVGCGTGSVDPFSQFNLKGQVRLKATNGQIIGGGLIYLNLDDGASFVQAGTLNAGFKPFDAAGGVFLKAQLNSRADFLGSTIVNNGSGKRFDITGGSVVRVPGGSATFLSGNVAGATTPGGQLIA